MRLDRDWYTGAEDGGVAGDEEHNSLSQYEDLRAIKEAEIAFKQVVSRIKSVFNLTNVLFRKRFPFGKPNM